MEFRDICQRGAAGVERLDKILSGAGLGRREAREAVRQGRVAVDGRVVTAPESKWPEDANLTLDGAPVAGGHIYIMLHKPAGVVSATRDGRERTVLDLLPPQLARRGLFPVGRLDKDVTGLVLLTDDGELAHRLLSPRRHVDKVYEVGVAGTLTAEDVAALAKGLTLADGTVCLPAKLVLTDDPSVGLLTLHEGKYHQVKRMMAALGKPVERLHRTSMGPLVLDGTLAPGRWRLLTQDERATLIDSSD